MVVVVVVVVLVVVESNLFHRCRDLLRYLCMHSFIDSLCYYTYVWPSIDRECKRVLCVCMNEREGIIGVGRKHVNRITDTTP